MTSWLEIGLSNALVATGLALVAAAVGRLSRHPKVAFAAWALVLAKLLMPPVAGIPGTQWQIALWQPGPIEVATQPPCATVRVVGTDDRTAE